MNVKHIACLAVIIAAALVPALPTGAATEPGRSTVGGTGPMSDELNAKTDEAVKKGLAYLAKNITTSGSISGGENIAYMALAGLAFLAHGDMPNDGQYGKEADQILKYMLKNCQESGLVASPGDGSPMYGHGFATLYLSEVYGMAQLSSQQQSDVGEKLRNAIRLICTTQNPQGGWRYQPLPNDADISVTICQVMALRAARNAGIKVPNKTIDNAIDYVKRSQCADGGFMYTLGGGGSEYPRSAAGVACLYYMRTGDAFNEEIKRGIAYIRSRIPSPGGALRAGGSGFETGHFYYGNYYATQAMFMYGGDAWEAYWPAIRDNLLEKQDKSSGNWTGESSTVYATSMALIMLQVPNRYLPILQK